MHAHTQISEFSGAKLSEYFEDLERLLKQQRRNLYLWTAFSVVFTVVGITVVILLLPKVSADSQLAGLFSLGGLGIGQASLFRAFIRQKARNASLESAIERFQRNELDVEARERLVSEMVSSL